MTHQLPLKDHAISAPTTSFNLILIGSTKAMQECKEMLCKAYEAIQQQGMTVWKADNAKSTLQDRISGWVELGATCGPFKYPMDYEEEDLVNYLVGSASVGYTCTRKQVFALIQGVVSRNDGNVGYRIVGEHPSIVVTFTLQLRLSYCWAVAYFTKILDNYYVVLEQTLVDNKLFDSPSQIFSIDETGTPLEPDLLTW